MIRRCAPLLALVALLVPSTLSAGVVEVELKLPMKPKIALEPDSRIAIAPFVVASSASDERKNRASRVDVQAEFQRFLSKQFSKATKHAILVVNDVRLPGSDMKALEADTGFWRNISRRTGADLIVSGVVDFDVEDKMGYKPEEFVSPVDGRTYYRQVLVESTGFVFDIALAVFDGDTGKKLDEEDLRDFKEFPERQYDEILGLFQNLRSLQSRILSLFVAQETSTTRFLFEP